MLEVFGLQDRGEGCLRWTITDGYGVLIEREWAFGRSLGGFVIHGERSVKSCGAQGNLGNIRGGGLRVCEKMGQARSLMVFIQGFLDSDDEPVPFFHKLSVSPQTGAVS